MRLELSVAKSLLKSVDKVPLNSIRRTKLLICEIIMEMNERDFYDFCSDLEYKGFKQFESVIFSCEKCKEENGVPDDCDCSDCCFDYWCKHYGINKEDNNE